MRLWGGAGLRWRAALADDLELKPGDRVLDVACGTGQFAVELARRVRPDGTVDGVDAAPEMVAQAQRSTGGTGLPLHFQTAPAQRLPYDDHTFDAVSCTLALHHIAAEDRPLAIAEMIRVLQPGGRLLLADAVSPTSRFRSLPARLLLRHAIAERTLEKTIDLLLTAGLVGISSASTTSAWIAQVRGTKPARSGRGH